MRPPRHQLGLIGAVIVILIILGALALILGRGAFQKEVGLTQREVTEANLKRVADALVAFTALNRRLPCPSQGTLDSGEADPDNATATCASAAGVVPWKSIALRRADALDGWGRKISYRVFAGTSGFTQADSMTMTNCNSSLGAALDSTLASGSMCKTGSPPPNTPAQFLATRGTMLVVQDSGTTRTGNAFVLISHGETGYGAYLTDAGGSRTTLPNSAGSEYPNAQSGGTYWLLANSAPGTPADAAGHFDDVVTYMGVTELLARAKLGARPWSNFPLSAQFTASAVEAAAPGFNAGTMQDTGRTSLSLGGFLVTAYSSQPVAHVGFLEQDSIGGIGVIGGSDTGGNLDSQFNESLTFQLGTGSEFHKMDVALNKFTIRNFSPLQEERAEISLWRAGERLQTSIVKSWHNLDVPSRCLFELVSGAVFDRMDVKPLTMTGGPESSLFTVAAIKACSEATASCATTVSGAMDCPSRPSSAASTPATGVGVANATIRGLVNDNGDLTILSFEFGTTTSYGSIVAATPGSVSGGAGVTAVSASIAGLTCNTTYHFRTKGVSAGGTTFGNDMPFTTASC